MSNLELYTKDARVWIPDADRVWKAGRLLENYEPTTTNLKVLIEDDQVEINYDIQSNQVPNPKLPPLRNPDILIGQNDLTALSYLNEPEVLYNLEVRFLTSNQIYTYCGIVLVAINPYESLPIYGNETIQAYNGRDVQNMDPHIFSVSESAFQKMIQFDQNQSIIVSGESGAGKTVSAKYAMRYFANVGGSSEETQVEKKVLASNPIMEAFGNAKTTRNDNSSRFGKFIQIDFNRSHHIVGGSMKTYLLEKSRVVFQAPQERNYHIFYQLCSQSDKKEYEYLRLGPASKFVYTNQGEAEKIDNVDDNHVFKDTLDAFKLLEISKKDQLVIFSLISAILHLGNVRISGEKSNEASFVAKNDQSISIMCDLLKIDENHMRAWLCNKRIKTVNEVVNTPLTLSQALFSRDALAKHMYSQLFNWVVSQINKCLKSPVKTHSFIGVLDIYGFETFQINSFEQFCINYANEKLQQQFCQHVFKLEQEEYVREQIKWSFIEFYDNQPCIELIEGKIGILDLLDEECKMPKGSDLTWCNKLYDKHLKPASTTTGTGSKNHFSKPRMSQKSFIIHHFAENVEYQVDGFLEKNRDTVLEEQLKVLKYSEIEFISEIFCEESDESKPKGYEVKRNTMPAPTKTQMIRKKTVGSQFRESLNNLMTALNSTTPHYVRCIKPNDLKAPFKFEAKRAVEQLRACGVLETVRISAAGYPSRWTYQEFFQRYRMLFKTLSSINRSNLKETCENILISLIKDETKYQFGKSKIFFQAGQVAYLEKLRSDKLKSAGIMIQKHIRGWLARSKFNKIKKSCLLIQCQSRGLLARRLLKHKKETRAAITIQSNWRAYMARKKYLKIKMDCVKLQSLCRGYLARKNRQLMILNVKATLIQAHVRGWLARIRYKKVKRGITLLQAHFRRRKARQLFKTLKIEARSVEHQKQLNKGLENKIISLQQQIEKINKERDLLNQKVIELEPLKSQIITLKQTSSQAKESNIKLNELNEELSQLKENYNKVKIERDDLIKEKNKLEKMNRESTSKSNQEISLLKSKLEESETKIVSLQVRIDQMKSQLIELENERANHQKLINEYSKLEQRFEKVKSDLLRLSNKNLNSTISLSSSTTSIPPHQHNLELESLIEELEQDSKTRSTTSSLAQDVANFEANKLLYMTPNGSEMDLRLISKLQRRIASLELERKESNFSRASKTLSLENDDDQQQQQNKSFLIEKLQMEKDYEMIKSQELELENQKLREDLNRLRDLIADNHQSSSTKTDTQINKEMMGQFDVLNEEVQRRRDECIHLKSLLIAKHRQQQRYNGENNSLNDVDMDALSDMSQIDTNGTNEFEIGYNTQKILNRILENQISDMKKSYDLDKANFVREIQNLNEEYEKQQDLLMQNMPPEHLIDATFKNEIMKLTKQNLELSEKCDQYSEEIKKYKKMLKVYIKRSKTINLGDRFTLNSSSTVSMNGLNSTAINDPDRSINTILNQTTNTLTPNYNNNNLAHKLNTNLNNSSTIYMPQIRSKHTGDYMGILEWKVEDEPKIISKLIDDLKPRLALTFLPGLPAYILFMCIRYADMSNDDEKVRLLLNSSVQSVKRLIKKKQEDLDYLVLWMTNFCRLIHNLKQYSGDEMFQSQNTPKQNEHCLKNFDLTEYRGIFSDISIWLFQGIIKDFEKKINPIIVGAMLEHDALSINDIKPNKSGVLNQTISSQSSNQQQQQSRITLETLTKKLNEFLNTLNSHGVDPEIVNQIFKQLFFFIGATTFNNLILRKEMCNWSKGIELRYNTSLLEQWVRDSKLQDSGACEMLDPVIQASQLLQARKSETDIQTICDMCPKLTIAQIQRILFWYTPLESFEEKLSRQFIDKVTDKLKEIRKMEQNSVQQVLVIDTQKQFPVCIPFNPSNIGLETIEIPDAIGLAPYVKKI
ncbi:unnamed protein product [Brachionus calyciflorus]|uniref:Unconventional myosin-Va-like n=1 Tax=Brachionus calyciflorus TaxID=104777 RepID=A0A813R7P0_9BILA|nr:unnamed protein product [Brachionus calyciflorus]